MAVPMILNLKMHQLRPRNFIRRIKKVVEKYKEIYKSHLNEDFPTDPLKTT